MINGSLESNALSIAEVSFVKALAASMHSNLIVKNIGTNSKPDYIVGGIDLVLKEIELIRKTKTE